MKLNCAIVDDEPLALNLLENYVRKTAFLNLVGRYSNAEQARSGLKDTPADLLFLDIQMPQLNGLLFAKTLPPATRVVFTTAFEQYAIDSYRVNAVDYLLKPFSYDEFLKAATKALNYFELLEAQKLVENAPIDAIFVKSERQLVRVELETLLYVEAMRDYVKFVPAGDEMPFFSLMSLKTLMEMLPSDKFMRIHRSYVVNLSKITSIDSNFVMFGDKLQVPIGGLYKNEVLQHLKENAPK